MTPHEEFRIYAISQQLDPKIAEPLKYAPELALKYSKDKLLIALSMIYKDFKPKSRSISLKPIVYSVLKFEAYSANKFVTTYMNDSLANIIADSLSREIIYRIDRIFSERIA